MLNLPKSTCNDIYRHTVQNLRAKYPAPGKNNFQLQSQSPTSTTHPTCHVEEHLEGTTDTVLNGPGPVDAELALLDLLVLECLDANKRVGRPHRLSMVEKARLIMHVRESWVTRQTSLVEIQCQAQLGHASLTTIYRALAEAGIKAYVEEFKFILDEENMLVRKVNSYYLAHHGPHKSNILLIYYIS